MKQYAESTLKRLTKDKLIEMIRCLESNVKELEEMNSNQFKLLMEKDMYAWHDLRKNPEDLPLIGTEVHVIILDTLDGRMKYAQDTYGYHDNSKSPNFLHHIRFRVIKWRYIEAFEEDNE